MVKISGRKMYFMLLSKAKGCQYQPTLPLILLFCIPIIHCLWHRRVSIMLFVWHLNSTCYTILNAPKSCFGIKDPNPLLTARMFTVRFSLQRDYTGQQCRGCPTTQPTWGLNWKAIRKSNLKFP